MTKQFPSVVILATSLLCAAAVGCEDPAPVPNGDAGAQDVVVVADGDAVAAGDGGEDAGPSEPWAAPKELNDFNVLYGYRGRVVGSNDDKNELWLMNPDGTSKRQITDLAEPGEGGYSCDYGCIASPDLSWLAVVTAPPTGTGFTFKIGRFNQELVVKLVKGAVFNDIIDFKFAGTRLFYSKIASCVGASCQYDVFMRDLSNLSADKVKLVTFPPSHELFDSIYKGHFGASDDGTLLTLLNPTIRSVSVYMWREGSGLVELDYICKFGSKGNCSGTGSEYTDRDPVAVSPDNRWITFFTFSDRWQRIRLYDTEDPSGGQKLTIAASVPTGSYLQKACDPGNLLPWQWQRVVGQPSFTPDGKEVIFTSSFDCPVVNTAICPSSAPCTPKKPLTNLHRIKLSTLQLGASLVEDDVFNITKNPMGDVSSNRRIGGFVIAPDSATIIFTGSPNVDQSGNIIKDGASRQRNDREVYRVRVDGKNLTPLSNSLLWAAESPRVVPVQQ